MYKGYSSSNSPTSLKWQTVADKHKESKSLDALDLAQKSEQVKDQLSVSLRALDLAVNKVKETNLRRESVSADVYKRSKTADICEEVSASLKNIIKTINKPKLESTTTAEQAAAPTSTPSVTTLRK